jgi:hypothetical protein
MSTTIFGQGMMRAMANVTRLLVPLAVSLSVLAFGALAGRPLTTEDAAVLEDKACQLEAWVDRARDVTTGWLVPACNFGWGIEWQVGFAREWEGGSRLPEAYVQAKGLFREATEQSRWSAGWVAGVTRRPTNELHRGWENPYVVLPVSFSAGSFNFHVQPGWARDREAGRDVTVWGAAIEHTTKPLDLVAEVFGQNSEKPFVCAGIRWTPIIDYLDVDLSFVTRPGGSRGERVVSIGFVWYGPPMLP